MAGHVALAMGVLIVFALYVTELIRTIRTRRPVVIFATARGRAKLNAEDYRSWAVWLATASVAWPVVVVGMGTGTLWLMAAGVLFMLAGGIVSEGLKPDRPARPGAQ